MSPHHYKLMKEWLWNWVEASLNVDGIVILEVLNAITIMIYAVLTDKKLAASSWIISKHKKYKADVW